MPDEFSRYYADYLDGSYDCVDRIVLNGYFRLAYSPGGFRTWWRNLHQGSDADLDNAHLMRLAGRVGRRVRGWAQAHDVPVIDCPAGERKDDLVPAYLPKRPDFVGVFLVLVGRVPAPIWDVTRSPKGYIVELARKRAQVNHYAFHILDPEWGHIVIKMCGHPPFELQIVLNGHEYVARQALQQGLDFVKEDNCFTMVTDGAQLAKVADTLGSQDPVGHLSQLCDRWVYTSCLCFALDLAEQQQTGFVYDYSLYQVEYSRNLLFKHGRELDQVFQGVIDRSRGPLDLKTLKTIFGSRTRPRRRTHQPPPRVETVLETPTYDLTVFKLHFGKLTVKLYSKGEHVLRSEAIVHNVQALALGRSLAKFGQVVQRLQALLDRFLNALHYIDASCIDPGLLETWPQPSQMGRSRVGGIDLAKPRLRHLMQAVIALAAAPQGFRLADLAQQVRQMTDDSLYTVRQAAYDLKKLRAKSLVERIGRSRRYAVPTGALKAMTAWLVLKDKVIKPVLANLDAPRHRPQAEQASPLDEHYLRLQADLRTLFQAIGIAADTDRQSFALVA
jgi:hypothetical protein